MVTGRSKAGVIHAVRGGLFPSNRDLKPYYLLVTHSFPKFSEAPQQFHAPHSFSGPWSEQKPSFGLPQPGEKGARRQRTDFGRQKGISFPPDYIVPIDFLKMSIDNS